MPTTVTILLVFLVTLCQAECPIECFCDEVTICSGGKQLTRFPVFTGYGEHAGKISRLELDDFLVQHLDPATFHSLISNITELRLTNNPELSSLDNNTFSLTIPAADLEDFRGAGENRKAEEKDDNGDDDFDTVTKNNPTSSLVFNLRTLDLSGNALKYFVGGGRLKRLRLLDLSSNRLQQVYGLDALTSLESVNLRDNQLERLDKAIFQNLANLQYINLDANRLVRLDPMTFSNLPSLAHLILSSNPIENLLAGFFWNSRVQYVDVSRVGLSRIPASMTTSVRDFRCANNNLTTIRQSDFESYPNVGLLVLDENSIETVEDDAFGRLDFLSRLWINGNRLRRIPQNLPPSLRSLQVEDNRISSLNTTDFKNLINLEELNLNGNQLGSLPAFIFSELINIRTLDLRSNLIDTLEKNSFANLIKLATLDVSGNPIKVIVNGVFKDLVKLSTLQLSRLEEPTVEFDTSTFCPLGNLQILELDDSPYLAKRILRGSGDSSNTGLSCFMSLIELNLERCNLEDLHMVSTALTESPLVDTLRAVKLSGNPWQCSSPPAALKEFIQLYKKQIVLDANQMICAEPRGIKVITVANKAAENISRSTKSGNNHSRTQSTSTTTLPSSSSTKQNSGPLTEGKIKPTLPPHTNLPTVTDRRMTTTTTTAASAASSTTVSKSPSLSSSVTSSTVRVIEGKTEGESSAGLEITITEKPTRSYFDDLTRGSTQEKTTTTSQPISNKDEENERKLFSSSTFSFSSSSSSLSPSSSSLPLAPVDSRDEIQDRDENPGQEHERASQTSSKTNDDNAIIDEQRNPTSFQHVSQQKKSQSGLQQRQPTTLAGSIDGFPAFHPHPDPVTMESRNTSSNATTASTTTKDRPNPSYLKSYMNGKLVMADDRTDEGKGEEGKTVIFKTLAILAVACLVSILFLLLLGVTIFRISWRFKSTPLPISVPRRNWDRTSEGECDYYYSSGSNNASYQNLNPNSAALTVTTSATTDASAIRRGPTGRSYTRLGDQDTVELSGITNRLYFENEDIYHIT